MRAEGGTPHLLLLTRDGRAVVNSRIRKYPERDPQAQIEDWKAKMQSSQALFDAFEGPKRVVRYEDLAMSTEAEVRALCDLMDIPYEAAMLDFTATEHHVLGGNSGTQYIAARAQLDNPADAFVSLNSRTRDYYKEHTGRIELDLRWKTELAPAHEALFNRLAGGVNESMKWEA